eukprot:228433-Hanusia_phi.AAC.5
MSDNNQTFELRSSLEKLRQENKFLRDKNDELICNPWCVGNFRRLKVSIAVGVDKHPMDEGAEESEYWPSLGDGMTSLVLPLLVHDSALCCRKLLFQMKHLKRLDDNHDRNSPPPDHHYQAPPAVGPLLVPLQGRLPHRLHRIVEVVLHLQHLQPVRALRMLPPEEGDVCVMQIAGGKPRSSEAGQQFSSLVGALHDDSD